MKFLIRSILLSVCLGLSSVAMAAEDTPTKIGVLDWQLLLQKAPQAEDAGKRLEKEFQGLKDKLVNTQKAFQTKREKMQRDADVMSAAERGKKEKELAKMEQDLRRMDEEFRSDYTTRHREEMDKFVQEVKNVIDKVADEEKYDLVLSQEAALYVADRIDITSKVLERLEKVAKSSPAKSSDKKAVGKKEAEDLKSEEKI
jgi:outer membrane protein